MYICRKIRSNRDSKQIQKQYEELAKSQADQTENKLRMREATHQMREQLRNMSRKYDMQLLEKLPESERRVLEANASEAQTLVQAELSKFKSSLPRDSEQP